MKSVLIISLIAACGVASQNSDKDLLTFAASAVSVADSLAGSTETDRRVTPLFVDIESLRTAVREKTGKDVTSKELIVAIKTPFQPATEQEAYRCAEPSVGRCTKAGGGVFVHFDSFLPTPEGYNAVVSISGISLGDTTSAACSAVRWGLEFKRVNGNWSHSRPAVISAC